MPFFENQGEQIHFTDIGEGPPVLLIHSLGATHEMWNSTVSALQSRFRVLAWDAVGHGASSHRSKFTVERSALTGLALLDHLGIDRVACVGISMGGHTAMHMALQAPGRISKMVLADTSLGGRGGDPGRVNGVKRSIEDKGYIKFARDYVASRLEAGADAAVIEQYTGWIASMPEGAYLEALESILSQDFRQHAARISVPTLVIVGENDISTPVAMARDLRDTLADAEIAVIPRANHFSNIDNPSHFNQEVGNFLENSFMETAVQADKSPQPTFILGPAKGSRIAVVGGCGGIGGLLVNALVEAGSHVFVLDLPQSLTNTRLPLGVSTFPIDVTNQSGIQAAFSELEKNVGALDGYVNLAGFTEGFHGVGDLPVDVWSRVVDVNLTGTFLCAQAALPMLRKGRNAALVHMASALGINTQAGYSHYGAAKAGVIALTKAIAREEAPQVRANVVAPTAVDTPFLRGGTGRTPEAQRINTDEYAKKVPLNRMASPADIVGPILFLLGQASAYITGETLLISGGSYLR